MAHKHQIWSSAKATRRKAGRKWRRAQSAALRQIYNTETEKGRKRAARILNTETAPYALLAKARMAAFEAYLKKKDVPSDQFGWRSRNPTKSVKCWLVRDWRLEEYQEQQNEIAKQLDQAGQFFQMIGAADAIKQLVERKH